MKTLQLLWQSAQNKLITFSQKQILSVSVALLFLLLIGFWFGCSSKPTWHMKTYRIGRDPTWYPLDLMDKDRNMLGFTNELLALFAQKEKVKLQLLNSSFENLVNGLDSKTYDAILSYLTPTTNLQRIYYFSDPIYLLGPVLIVRSDSTITSLEQMDNKLIGVLAGGSMIFNIDRFPSLLITSYDNGLAALSDLEKDVIDGVIMNALQAHSYTHGIYANRLKIVAVPLTDQGIRLIAHKTANESELVDAFNKMLKEMIQDGSYQKLLEHWGLFNTLQRQDN